MKTLVIGGAGYIGSALVAQLLAAGHTVSVLDCCLYGRQSLAKFEGKINFVKSDFRDFERTKTAMAGCDCVVLLGAIVGDRACDIDRALTLDINYVQSVECAKLAKSVGVRQFVFSSTCSVYGQGDGLLTEDSPLNPVSLYAESKILAEQEIRALCDPGFAVYTVRYGTIYGFSGRVRFDLVVNLLTAKAVRDGEITVYGGEQWRPLVHVEDAARAILHLLGAGVSGEVYNVGSSAQNYKIATIGELIQKSVPTAALKTFCQDVDRRDYRVDFSKIEALGFRPSWSLLAGIEQVKRDLEKIDDYKAVEYNNYAALTAGAIEKLRGWRQ